MTKQVTGKISVIKQKQVNLYVVQLLFYLSPCFIFHFNLRWSEKQYIEI